MVSQRRFAALAELFRHTELHPAALRDLRRRMSAPGRHYHGLEHVANLWVRHRHFGRGSRLHARGPQRRIACIIAFHDAIYDPRRTDNEAASAALWRRYARFGRPMPRGDVDRVALAIEATANHAGDADAADLSDPEMRWVLDLDLAPLGATPHRFWRNTSWLRVEQAFLPTPEWQRRRLGFFAAVAGRSAIYHVRPVRAAFEAMARANIGRELRAGRDQS